MDAVQLGNCTLRRKAHTRPLRPLHRQRARVDPTSLARWRQVFVPQLERVFLNASRAAGSAVECPAGPAVATPPLPPRPLGQTDPAEQRWEWYDLVSSRRATNSGFRTYPPRVTGKSWKISEFWAP